MHWPLACFFLDLGAKNCFYICKELFKKEEYVTPMLDPKSSIRGDGGGISKQMCFFCEVFASLRVFCFFFLKRNLIEIHTRDI